MTQANSKPDLAVSTRDLVFAFLLAKGVAVVGALAIMSVHKDHEDLAFIAANAIAVGVFLTLVLLTGKLTLPRLIEATRVSGPSWPMYWVAAFILLAVPLGLLLRFGSGGLLLGVLRLFDPASAGVEIADAVSGLRRQTADPLTWMLVIHMLTGAAEEEFIYRQVLQSRLCGRYGSTAGILIVSVLFYAMHPTNPMSFIAGIFLSLLYVFTGRLWVPIVAHATANLAFPALAALHVPADGAGLSMAMDVSAAVLCVVIAALFVAISKRTVPPYARLRIIQRGRADTAAK